MKRVGQVLLASVLLIAAGCVTVGRDFPGEPVKKIVNGTTTRDEIRATFGEPYQKGIDNGGESWTYYRVNYRGSAPVQSKELYVVFDSRGIVESHSFTETVP
jgi:hypothetical protein